MLVLLLKHINIPSEQILNYRIPRTCKRPKIFQITIIILYVRLACETHKTTVSHDEGTRVVSE